MPVRGHPRMCGVSGVPLSRHVLHCTSMLLVCTRTYGRLNRSNATHACLGRMQGHMGLPTIASDKGRLHGTVQLRHHLRLT